MTHDYANERPSNQEAATLGQIVDGLHVAAPTVQDGDLITDVLVITKIVDAEGGIRLAHRGSPGMGWVERLGLISAVHERELDELRGGKADWDPS